jgi:nucleoside 2-deoxyribosyltransferase
VLDRDCPLAYVASSGDLMFILNNFVAKKLLTYSGKQDGREVYVVTAEGWEEAESIEKPVALREKAFVAMWFNDEVKPAFHDGIEPAIKDTGYLAIRIDPQEHAESVIDRIFAEIKESRFVVADYTGHRGGVYFEAGFARGLGLNVIWTCKDDHFKDIHFDVRGFNVIVWKTTAELRERLNARIRAIVGYGPLHDASAPIKLGP